MNWFSVELEILIYGKHFEIVKADNNQTAEIIAIKKCIENYNCTIENISLVSCKKINSQN